MIIIFGKEESLPMENSPFVHNEESLKVAYIAASFFILFVWWCAKNTQQIIPERIFPIEGFQ
jgi:hypothetical protein